MGVRAMEERRGTPVQRPVLDSVVVHESHILCVEAVHANTMCVAFVLG